MFDVGHNVVLPVILHITIAKDSHLPEFRIESFWPIPKRPTLPPKRAGIKVSTNFTVFYLLTSFMPIKLLDQQDG